jgi:hypothetical protein
LSFAALTKSNVSFYLFFSANTSASYAFKSLIL